MFKEMFGHSINFDYAELSTQYGEAFVENGKITLLMNESFALTEEPNIDQEFFIMVLVLSQAIFDYPETFLPFMDPKFAECESVTDVHNMFMYCQGLDLRTL